MSRPCPLKLVGGPKPVMLVPNPWARLGQARFAQVYVTPTGSYGDSVPQICIKWSS